jgi:NADH-quinone oxidoreductase subunit H
VITYAQLIVSIVLGLVLFGVIFSGAGIYSFYERKVAAWTQSRYGPNRVGPKGYFQFIADGTKFLLKEDIVPSFVNKPVFILAPAIVMIPALLVHTVIPIGAPIALPEIAFSLFGYSVAFPAQTIDLQVLNINVGVLFALAVASLGIYGIVFGAWASNSKYPLLGGLRASAQMVSYELSMGLALITVVLISGSLDLRVIIAQQAGYWFGFIPKWNIIANPLAFFVFLVTMFAETNRLPFDLAEAEQELIGGYHTEYSSMKFAVFMLSEYINMITLSMLMVVFFLGGWHIPGMEAIGNQWVRVALSIAGFAMKTLAFCFLYMWVRWTLPRFRYDQLMSLGWKVLLPMGLVAVASSAIWLAIF